MMEQSDPRPPGWYPKGAKLVQLRDGRKRPATSTGHLAGVVGDDFVPLGQNVGIVLDGQFVLVDADRAVPEDWAVRLPTTWKQKTPRGTHWIYRLPPGFQGTNAKWVGGDIKTLGYAVAPGSYIDPRHEENAGHPGGEYRLLNAREPAPAPQWLLDLCARPSGQEHAATATLGDERDFIPDGERDNELTRLAGFLHGPLRLSEDGIRAALMAVLESGAVEQPPGREKTHTDAARIARSIARKPVGEAALGLLPEHWRTGDEVPEHPELMDWVLPGFVPGHGLTIMYGDGKVGKSTWVAWLAARVTRDGLRVLFIPSGEETFEQFVTKARLAGAHDGALICWPTEVPFILPKSVADLERGISMLSGGSDVPSVGLVYIDALYSHFGEGTGENEAVRARSRLRALAQAAIEGRFAVLGTIHENASGGLLGSREMRNVARSLIHATRREGGDLIIRSKGSNSYAPDYGVSFPGTAVPILTPDGKPFVFEDIFGEKIEQANWVVALGEKIEPDPPANSGSDTINLDNDSAGTTTAQNFI
jgi:hypothetical protein